jgi:hypothetical protein
VRSRFKTLKQEKQKLAGSYGKCYGKKKECHTHKGGPREIKQIKASVRQQKTNHNYRSLPTDENTLFIWRRQQHAIWKLHFCEIKYLPLHLTGLCVPGCGKNTTHAKRKGFLQIKVGM